jgi:hypothetical protein
MTLPVRSETKGKRGGDGPQQVGYRSPPKAHRFKKGRSGNLLGRPPKSQTTKPDRSTLGNAYIAEAHRKLRITEAGKVSQLKTIEIAVRRQGMAAVGGELKGNLLRGYGLPSTTSVQEMINCSTRRWSTSRCARKCETIMKGRAFVRPSSKLTPMTF